MQWGAKKKYFWKLGQKSLIFAPPLPLPAAGHLEPEAGFDCGGASKIYVKGLCE
jgi:hypothetical protein